jgi:phosphoribosylformimino-5-aminoimidazole carboxamide ribotide isomerase
MIELGADKFILGVDVKNEYVAIKGWTETTQTTIYDVLDTYLEGGITHIFCTDISKDGLLAGPSIALYTKLLAQYPNLQLIASGGVSSIHDIEMLYAIGCKAAIVGKAFYEGKIDIKNPVNVC